MQNEKRTKSLLIYYLLVSGLTNLVFVVFGAIAFILLPPTLNLDTIFTIIVLFVLLLKSLIVGYVTYWAQTQARFDKVYGTRFIGLYFGRFFGFIIGAFLGAEIAKGIGAIIGALSFYFVGRWLGSKVGFFIGHFLDRNMQVADVSEKVIAKPSSSINLFFIGYTAIFPLLMVLLALYFKFTDLQFVGLPADWLPPARIVVIALSLFSLAAPWLIQNRISHNQMPISTFNILWLGLGLSIIPVIYGFFLFTMGASIIELGVFAVTSSFAAIIWSIKTSVKNQKVG